MAGPLNKPKTAAELDQECYMGLVQRFAPKAYDAVLTALDDWSENEAVGEDGLISYRPALDRLKNASSEPAPDAGQAAADRATLANQINAVVRSELLRVHREAGGQKFEPETLNRAMEGMTGAVISSLSDVTLERGKSSRADIEKVLEATSKKVQTGPSEMHNRFKGNFEKLLEKRTIDQNADAEKQEADKKHNEWAADFKKKWAEKKQQEEKDRIAREQAAAAKSEPANKKKDSVDDHGPKPAPTHASGGDKGSLPNQLWDRAMYEDKAILMAMALDIAMLSPVLLLSFFSRWAQHGLGHAVLMTLGMEELPQYDPGLDRWILDQLGVTNGNSQDNSANPSTADRIKAQQVAAADRPKPTPGK